MERHRLDLFNEAISYSGNLSGSSWKNFIYAIPCKEKYLIYQPLKKLAFIANQSMVSFIGRVLHEGLKVADYSKTDAYRFLNSVRFFDTPVFPDEPSGTKTDFKPAIAVLLLTTSCNFRCTYCYASSGSKKGSTMSLETGYSAIDLVCNNAMAAGEKSFMLNFHGGGEPTVAWEKLCNLVNYARSRKIPAKISLQTNGYLNRQKLDWIMANMDEISLSCDGTHEIQNAQRPLQSGGNTFDTVLKTIKALDRNKKAYGIRLTVTDSTVNSLPDSMAFFCKETGCKSFQAEPAFDHGRAKGNRIALANQNRFITSFLAAYDIAARHQRTLFYSGARLSVLTSTFCQAPINALIVSNKGLLTTCYEVFDPSLELGPLFFIGSLQPEQAIEIDAAKHRLLLGKIEERRKLCLQCFCYWHCAGDCPAKTLTSQGDEHLYAGIRCNMNREITKELLLRKIHESGGVWMDENTRHAMVSSMEFTTTDELQ